MCVQEILSQRNRVFLGPAYGRLLVLAQILEKEKVLQYLSNPLKRLYGNMRDRTSMVLLENFQQGSEVDEPKVEM